MPTNVPNESGEGRICGSFPLFNQDEIEGRRLSADEAELEEGDEGAVLLGLWVPVAVTCFSPCGPCGEKRGVGGDSSKSGGELAVRGTLVRLRLGPCGGTSSISLSTVGEEYSRLRFLLDVIVVVEEVEVIPFPHVVPCCGAVAEFELLFDEGTAASS